jgi:hypothetical protein
VSGASLLGMAQNHQIVWTCDGCGDKATVESPPLQRRVVRPEGWGVGYPQGDAKDFCAKCLKDAPKAPQPTGGP